MPENVVLIPQKQKKAIREQKLRAAAYCRVSTKHEEQLGSLENQIAYYTYFIRQVPNRKSFLATRYISERIKHMKKPPLALWAICLEGAGMNDARGSTSGL